MSQFKSIAIPKFSPWGRVQGGEEIAPGIVSVYTSSHGGIKVSRERLAAMPAALRDIGERSPYHHGIGWFEDDCEWCAVAVAFPDAFQRTLSDGKTSLVSMAQATLNRYFPEAAASLA